MKQYTARLFSAYAGLLLEGFVWDHRRKFWIGGDFLKSQVVIVEPSGNVSQIKVPDRIASVILTKDPDWYVVTQEGRLAYCNPWLPEGQRIRFIDGPVAPENRHFNDVSAIDGRNIVGGSVSATGNGIFGRLQSNGTWSEQFGGCFVSNGHGLVGTTLYYVDSKYPYVRAIERDADGNFRLENSRIAFQLQIPNIATSIPIVADGMKVDVEGNLWIALNGFGVHCYTPTGELLAVIECPGAREITNISFGGEDMQYLIIVTADERTDPGDRSLYPNNGRIFICRVDVPGLPSIEFDGQPDLAAA